MGMELIGKLKEVNKMKEQKYKYMIEFYQILKKHQEALEQDDMEGMEETIEKEEKCKAQIEHINTQYYELEDQILQKENRNLLEKLCLEEIKKNKNLQKCIEETARLCTESNTIIIDKTKEMMKEIEREIVKVHQNRELSKANIKYVNPYDQASQEAYFIDKKK